MRKYTLFGYHNEIQDFAVDFLKMKGHVIETIDSSDAKKYMSKNLLIMGDIDIELLSAVLPKVRVIVYVGSDEEVKVILRSFAEEKDIKLIVSNNTISGEIEVYKDEKKIIEIYSSFIFSELELITKYLIGDTGPKVSRLARYLSQFFMNRSQATFDHPIVRQLADMHEAFKNYRDHADDNELIMTKEDFLNIYNKHDPNGN